MPLLAAILALCSIPQPFELPSGSEFIPATVIHRKALPPDGFLHWGAPQCGWNAALAPARNGVRYVVDGGGGERHALYAYVHMSPGSWALLDGSDALSVRWRLRSGNLPELLLDHEQDVKISRDLDDARRDGAVWRLIDTISSGELVRGWGRLPEQFVVTGEILIRGVPIANTGALAVGTESIPFDDASFLDRVASLPRGVPHAEVLRLLGRPARISVSRATGSATSEIIGYALEYPTDEAPANATPNRRVVSIFLSPQGRVTGVRLNWRGC